jgi:hypothetical protein
MSETIKGIIHVHSDFSRDGLHSVADLAEFGRESGFRFVGLTDHAEDFSPQDMKDFKEECEKHSDDTCVVIPGLEFRCAEDVHILALGINGGIHDDDPVKVASEIGRRGGLAILAHPCRNGYQCSAELCRVLNGIEIWNAGYDGRFVPPLANIRLLQEARAYNPSILGFGGADLHGFDRPPGIVLELPTSGIPQIDAEMLLQRLRTGRFSVCGRFMSFDANTNPYWLTRFALWLLRRVYETSKAIRNAALGEA